MRLSLTDDQLATLDLALQDRVFVLKHYAGSGPLVTRQIESCEALRTHIAKPNHVPKRKAKAPL